jgi:ATP-dependent DNA helicase Rep
MLIGVTEGMLPFRMDDEAGSEHTNESLVTRLEEERRLMYVGITRAKNTLSVSWTKRRKKGRDMVVSQPVASSPKWLWTKPPSKKIHARSCGR